MKPLATEVASILEEAVKLMNDKGAHWVKGSYRRELPNDELAYCSVGAIRQIVYDRTWDSEQRLLLRSMATSALADALPSDPEHPYPEDKIVVWNDRVDTTWAKVRLRFRRAAKSLREGE